MNHLRLCKWLLYVFACPLCGDFRGAALAMRAASEAPFGSSPPYQSAERRCWAPMRQAVRTDSGVVQIDDVTIVQIGSLCGVRSFECSSIFHTYRWRSRGAAMQIYGAEGRLCVCVKTSKSGATLRTAKRDHDAAIAAVEDAQSSPPATQNCSLPIAKPGAQRRATGRFDLGNPMAYFFPFLSTYFLGRALAGDEVCCLKRMI